MRYAILFYNYIEAFALRRLFPIIGFFLILYLLTPLGPLVPFKLNASQLHGIAIFFIVVYGAKMLHSNIEVAKRSQILSLSPQNGAIREALAKIPKSGTKIDILIYTSFSLFSNLEELLKIYPALENSTVRVLVRDPDIPSSLPKGKLSITRIRQLNTAIDSLARYSKAKRNIEVRYYQNEPWVRGIKVGDQFLNYSTYSDKRFVSPGTDEPEYSGSRTPWLSLDTSSKTLLHSDIEQPNNFIGSFDSLFNLIWNNCTKYKTIILDLDGTLFKDENLSKYLVDTLPIEYFKKICKEQKIADMSKSDEMFKEYKSYLSEEKSSTESILLSIKKILDIQIKLEDYLSWKDSEIENYPISIGRDDKLISAIAEINSTYKLYILTNHTKRFTKIAIEKLGLNGLLIENNLICIENIGSPKPNSYIPFVLETKYKINLKTTIFIGDRDKVDLEYVRDYCLGTILVKNVSCLPKVLADLKYPLEWIKSQEQLYQGIDISKNQF